MAMSKRKNWTNEESDKFVDLMYEMKSKEGRWLFSKVTEQLIAMTKIERSELQLKYHLEILSKKLKGLDAVLGMTGVGYCHRTQLPIIDDERWEQIIINHPSYKTLRTEPVRNADKLRFLFFGKQATGQMSFSPGMDSIPTNVGKKMKGVRIDITEGSGDSDDSQDDINVDPMACYGGDGSQSPPKSLQTTSRKRKSEDGSSRRSKTLQKVDDASDIALHILNAMHLEKLQNKVEPSIFQKVDARVNGLDEVKSRGPELVFQVIEIIKSRDEMEYFLGFSTDELALVYIKSRLLQQNYDALKLW